MTTSPDPIAEFQSSFERARRRETSDPTAAALGTCDHRGRPAVRMVLLKAVDPRGFVFYTNFESRKAKELDENPWAALCFHWPVLAEQVRIEGPVETVEEAEANAYFASRERGSQVGAWVSKQSQPLTSRAELVARYAKTQARFAGKEVPRPPFWGGYRLRPERIEMWFNQLHRLHDRRLYLHTDQGWTLQRLYP
jgi:pyridoxamine 5'-phosphate oxidase